jgi:hypothetical protein
MTSGAYTFQDSVVGVWRFGRDGGVPLIWCHGGLSCGAVTLLTQWACYRCARRSR